MSSKALEHPLPEGMRDLLPEEAERRRDLAQRLLARFARRGYRIVTLPIFELATVLERGLKSSDHVAFVEPDSGELCILRPDMTAQIARMVATRFADRTPPFRLAYEGTVVRRRTSRTKKHRQIPQVGVELCGVSGADGDLELLELAADALGAEGAGLEKFVIDLSDAGIVRALLADVEPTLAGKISQALARKDEPSLQELCAGVPRIIELAHLQGGRDAIVDAVTLCSGTAAEAPARRLLALFDAASERGLGARLSADPGEVRALAYYTGMIFSLYAEGPGEPIGGGGRYDELLGRYGAPQPAVGFGLDLDALAMALECALETQSQRAK